MPLTLTAVHHVRAEDSGIGSGVLNTMQQVGGALGLAILSTVASHYTSARNESSPRPAQRPAVEALQRAPCSCGGPGRLLGSFTEGATAAFMWAWA